MSDTQAKATPSKAMAKFLKFVSINGECWQWTGLMDWKGYSSFWDGVKRFRGHRFAYENFVGKIPEGLQLDHLCRNRACVNPAHLEPVTAKENSRRGFPRQPSKAERHNATKVIPSRCSSQAAEGAKYATRNASKYMKRKMRRTETK